MYKCIFLLVFLLCMSCDSENGSDCFQKTGTIIQTEVEVEDFSKIIVWEGVQLFVQKGESTNVLVETGENLLNDIDVSVTGGLLSLKNNNSCNFIRDYDVTKIYVTTPNLTEIRNSSSLEVKSIGVLDFPSLLLLAEDYGNEDEFHIDGDFNLSIDVEEVSISSNGFASFVLTGEADRAIFGFYASNTRLDASELIAQDIQIFHRSSNVMIVNPQQSIRGKIVSIGDVISLNEPPIVEVEELYEGRLIFD